MRAELRQEILSVVAAHVELGSTRDDAIRLALAALSQSPVNSPVQQPASHRADTRQTVSERRRTRRAATAPGLKAFGIAAGASLLLLAIRPSPAENEALFLLALVLAVFPFLAGRSLGARNSRYPLSGVLLAQLLLYLPITTGFYLLVSSQNHVGSDFAAWPWTAAYLSISTLFGGAGVIAGKWLKKTNLRITRRASRV